MQPTVILPLDRSSVSERAIPVASDLASRTGAVLLVVTVIEAPSHLAEWSDARDATKDVIQHWSEQHGEVDAYLEGVASMIHGLPVETCTLAGNPVRKINELATHVESPVIVMASHGRSGWQRLRLGSVATSVVQSSSCPVIVVPADGRERGSPFDRMLVALDGSEFAEEALGALQAVLGEGSLTLHLLRVVETATIVGGVFGSFLYSGIEYYIDAMREEAQEYLDRVGNELRAAGNQVSWEVRVGAVAEEVDCVAADRDAGLIVMSTHGRSGFQHLLLGSVAEHVVHHASIPLFVVRPGVHGPLPGRAPETSR